MSPREVLEAWLEAFNANDADRVAALYAADAVNHQVAQRPIVGREEIRSFHAEFFASARVVCLPVQILEDGEWAALEWTDPQGLQGSGFFHVVDGKIAFQRGYWDQRSFERLHGDDR